MAVIGGDGARMTNGTTDKRKKLRKATQRLQFQQLRAVISPFVKVRKMEMVHAAMRRSSATECVTAAIEQNSCVPFRPRTIRGEIAVKCPGNTSELDRYRIDRRKKERRRGLRCGVCFVVDCGIEEDKYINFT